MAQNPITTDSPKNTQNFIRTLKMLSLPTIHITFGHIHHHRMASKIHQLLTRIHRTTNSETVSYSATCNPNLQLEKKRMHLISVHFYNYLSDGWSPSIFPRPRFASEYGFQSLPSLQSWRSVMGPNDNLLELIEHRQHFPLGSVPIIHLIESHLPLPDESSDGYAEAFIYFSQISQAMATKIETETYRIGRGKEAHTMGALYWQLNDVWVAPSWSSIDFNGVFKVRSIDSIQHTDFDFTEL